MSLRRFATWAISISTLLCCSHAPAQWSGRPWHSATNSAGERIRTWHELQAEYEPYRQLIEAIQERVAIVRATVSTDFPPFELVQSWTVDAGVSNFTSEVGEVLLASGFPGAVNGWYLWNESQDHYAHPDGYYIFPDFFFSTWLLSNDPNAWWGIYESETGPESGVWRDGNTYDIVPGAKTEFLPAQELTWLVTTNVVTTNAVGPFEYQYTDETGTYTATGFPFVTHAAMAYIDLRLYGYHAVSYTNDLTRHFVHPRVIEDRRYAERDTLGVLTNAQGEVLEYPVYFESGTIYEDIPGAWGWEVQYLGGIEPDDVWGGVNTYGGIRLSYPPTMHAGEIGGLWTNVTLVGQMLHTNTVRQFTRQPDVTNRWVLAEWSWDGEQWNATMNSRYDWNVLDSSLYPEVWITTTGNVASVTVDLDGDVLGGWVWAGYGSPISAIETNEQVVITTTNRYSLDHRWYDIQFGSSVVGSAPNTGDYITVAYEGPIATYGRRPYRLYASDLEERAMYLDQLIHSWGDPLPGWYDVITHSGLTDERAGRPRLLVNGTVTYVWASMGGGMWGYHETGQTYNDRVVYYDGGLDVWVMTNKHTHATWPRTTGHDVEGPWVNDDYTAWSGTVARRTSTGTTPMRWDWLGLANNLTWTTTNHSWQADNAGYPASHWKAHGSFSPTETWHRAYMSALRRAAKHRYEFDRSLFPDLTNLPERVSGTVLLVADPPSDSSSEGFAFWQDSQGDGRAAGRINIDAQDRQATNWPSLYFHYDWPDVWDTTQSTNHYSGYIGNTNASPMDLPPVAGYTFHDPPEIAASNLDSFHYFYVPAWEAVSDPYWNFAPGSIWYSPLNEWAGARWGYQTDRTVTILRWDIDGGLRYRPSP